MLDHITTEPIEEDAVSLGCRSDASDCPKARKCRSDSSSSSGADANIVNRRVLIRAQKENLTDCVKDQWVCADSSRNKAASDASLDSQV